MWKGDSTGILIALFKVGEKWSVYLRASAQSLVEYLIYPPAACWGAYPYSHGCVLRMEC
jgi:hypothetical protein